MGIFCGVSNPSEYYNIMLLGLSLSGKTYFLYRHLKNLIKRDKRIKTVTTYGFNIEKISSGATKLAIWDFPGKESMRIFWPLYYRSVQFTGAIYIINYDEKETLDEGKFNL